MKIAVGTPEKLLGVCKSHPALEPVSAPDNGLTPVIRPQLQTNSRRSPVETRLLAKALERLPVPLLTNREVENRWRVGADTLRKVLRFGGIDIGFEKKGGLVPLTALLAFEEFSDPLVIWLMSTDDMRAILRADLLTPEEVCEGLGSLPPMHMNSLYRRLEDGRLSSVRIGKQYRFRRSLESARHWMTQHEEAQA